MAIVFAGHMTKTVWINQSHDRFEMVLQYSSFKVNPTEFEMNYRVNPTEFGMNPTEFGN